MGTASDGTVYRLRDGLFNLTGYPEQFPGSPGPAAGSGGGPTNSGTFTGGFGGTGAGFYQDTISTEADPDAAVITKQLVPGFYTVSLEQGWRIERLTETGAETVESVLLFGGTGGTGTGGIAGLGSFPVGGFAELGRG